MTIKEMTVREAVAQAKRKIKPFAIGALVGAGAIVGLALATAPEAHAAPTTNGVERCMEVLNNAGFAGPELCEPLEGTPTRTLPPCPTEDSDNCVWDAAMRGNRLGQGFVRIHGRTYYAS